LKTEDEPDGISLDKYIEQMEEYKNNIFQRGAMMFEDYNYM